MKFELFNSVSCKKLGQKLAKFFKVKNLSFSKIMNNGDTVAKKDFTVSFKSKKRRGF
jgi:hypothetical protein